MKNKIKYSKLKIKEEKEDIMAIDKTRLVEISQEFKRATLVDEDCTIIERRCDGPFLNKAIYLSLTYDWVLGRDEDGVLCLVPLKQMPGEKNDLT